jgi:hypothetical protein
MSRKLFASIVSLVLLAGCQAEREPTTPLMEIAASAAVSGPGGFRTVSFPENDPGPPFYSRVTTLLNQIFHDGGYVAIPFYRDLACIPPDFNLLDAFHFPSQDGPGAFGCPLVVHGTLLIEPDAPLGTFPFQVMTRGPAHVWFVPWAGFQAAMADGDITMNELIALEPLRGVADQYNEVLHPRMEKHHVVITSHGRLEDGRRFQFNVNHPGDATKSILIRIR